MNIRTVKPKLAAAGIAAAMVAVPATALAGAATTATTVANWQIPLKGSAAYPKANGSAPTPVPARPTRDPEIKVQHIRSMAGKTVGFQRRRHHSRRRQGAPAQGRRTSPATRTWVSRSSLVAHGSTVTVRTAGGMLIASGRFLGHRRTLATGRLNLGRRRARCEDDG